MTTTMIRPTLALVIRLYPFTIHSSESFFHLFIPIPILWVVYGSLGSRIVITLAPLPLGILLLLLLGFASQQRSTSTTCPPLSFRLA